MCLYVSCVEPASNVGGSAAAAAASTAPSADAETATPLRLPTSGFLTSAVDGYVPGAAASTTPSMDAETATELFPPVSEGLMNPRSSTPGPFGAFGETFMAMLTALAASGTGDGSQITMMVESGVSEYFLKPFLTPGLRGLMRDYFPLAVSHTIVTAGQYVLESIATGTVRGHVIDVSGAKELVTFPAVVVPGLGRNLFSVAMSAAVGIVTVFDCVRPRLELGGVVLPMVRLGDDQTLYTISVELVHDSDGAAMRVESAVCGITA